MDGRRFDADLLQTQAVVSECFTVHRGDATSCSSQQHRQAHAGRVPVAANGRAVDTTTKTWCSICHKRSGRVMKADTCA